MQMLVVESTLFSMYRIGSESLPEAIRFITETNYKCHQNGNFPEKMQEEIDAICREEEKYFPESYFYVAKCNRTQQMIGCIRIFHWDGTADLSIQTKYGVNITDTICKEKADKEQVWHVGRLAIDDRLMGRTSIIMLKTMLAYMANHACSHENGIVFAECDRKLWEKLNLFQVNFKQAGESRFELGSEAVPVYNTSDAFMPYLEKHKHLCHV